MKEKAEEDSLDDATDDELAEEVDGDEIDLLDLLDSPPQIPIRRSSPKVGRNDPCPCGSGKKYKKCCGA